MIASIEYIENKKYLKTFIILRKKSNCNRWLFYNLSLFIKKLHLKLTHTIYK